MSSVKKTLKKHFGGTRIEKMEKTSNDYIKLIENERKNIIEEKKYIIKLITMEKTVALKHIREILKKIKKHPNYYASYKRQFEDVYYTFKKNIRSIVETANKLSSNLRIDKSRSFESDDQQNEESDQQNDSIPPKSATRRKLPTNKKSATRRKSPSSSKSPDLDFDKLNNFPKTLNPSKTPAIDDFDKLSDFSKTLNPSKTLSPSESPSPQKTLSSSELPNPQKTLTPPIPPSSSKSSDIDFDRLLDLDSE